VTRNDLDRAKSHVAFGLALILESYDRLQLVVAFRCFSYVDRLAPGLPLPVKTVEREPSI
jgi:hypothetical protein